MKKNIGLYELSVITFFFNLPTAGIIIEIYDLQPDLKIGELILKWFVFSSVGLRLLTAGLKQIIDPTFTTKEVFKLNDEGVSLSFGKLDLPILASVR